MYYVQHPRTKKWESVGKTFTSMGELVEAAKVDGYMEYHEERNFERYNSRDVYIICSPLAFKFRKEHILSGFYETKEKAEVDFYELPITAPAHYEDYDNFMNQEGFREVEREELVKSSDKVVKEKSVELAPDGKLF